MTPLVVKLIIRKMLEGSPLQSALIHTFSNFSKEVDQGGSVWIRVDLQDQGDHKPCLVDQEGRSSTFTFC